MTDNPLEDIREHSKLISINGEPSSESKSQVIIESESSSNSNSDSNSKFKEIPHSEILQKQVSAATLDQIASESIQPRATGELETTGLSFLFALRGGRDYRAMVDST